VITETVPIEQRRIAARAFEQRSEFDHAIQTDGYPMAGTG